MSVLDGKMCFRASVIRCVRVMLILLSAVALPVLAQTPEQAVQPLVDKINNIIIGAQITLAAASVLVFIYAGYLHMTAEGQPDREQKARKTAIGGLIGLALILLAETIKTVIINLLS